MEPLTESRQDRLRSLLVALFHALRCHRVDSTGAFALLGPASTRLVALLSVYGDGTHPDSRAVPAFLGIFRKPVGTIRASVEILGGRAFARLNI